MNKPEIHKIAEEGKNLQIVLREPGTLVPEGLSCSGEGYRIHITYQKVLEDGKILRVRIAIPRDSVGNLTTWSCSEIIYEKAEKT